ncbi:ABC transporter ATP-binding protein [Aquipseudomonas ullengensis]|uniref:ABC transporter ATP-binding protein n=1 Tax=Aquipseudomonas ullengensis TaxID=2759166 RepID=A0A7W4LPA9_9GAMM|nr:ABC transporter ATP-binding protein [Pseudomonas ullengensis]MBB2496851.1 ABC transporter ATP-binding protein [Pseudomonas ullengensis]
MQTPAISLKGVSKFYKLYKASKDRLKEALHPFGKKYHDDYYAIRDLNLEVKHGEILGIVGRNGCGKSTLLKLISRVLQPSAGEIRVNGKITALLELGAGFNPEFTGRDNIRFYSTILGLSAKEIEQMTPAVIEFAELGQFIDQPVKTYSSGMKSRLGFAVAVHVEPDILILDEVLAVGDAVFKRKCFAKMEEFFKAGKTVLFVSHDANAVNKLCTRAVLLHGGNIILDGKPGDVTRYYEKLAHAKQQSQATVLVEIAKFQQQPSSFPVPNSEKYEAPSVKQATPGAASPYYIPELISKSALAYTSDRAEIFDPHITTPSGKRVNVLLSGEPYIYSYQVHFLKEARKVSFGMQIKDIHGMRITGASLSHDSSRLIEYVQAGTALKISWHFDCDLLDGHFFTNAGVSENLDGSPVFLARAVDAIAFKVMPPKNSLTRGIVDLGQTLEVEGL